MYTPAEAIEAMIARRKGEWDNSQLTKIGSLSPDVNQDILRILELCENPGKRYIVLAEYNGNIIQQKTELSNLKAVKEWAIGAFVGRTVVVDMSNYDNKESLSPGVAEMIYRYGTIEGKALPPMQVFEVTFFGNSDTIQLRSNYHNQTMTLDMSHFPGAVKPELETAIRYLESQSHRIVGYCTGKEESPSYVITQTFEPLPVPIQ